MKFVFFICICILFDTAYAFIDNNIHGQTCSTDLGCKGKNEVCLYGRCTCKQNTIIKWSYAMKYYCGQTFGYDLFPKCKSNKDCDDDKVCNTYGMCVCPQGEIDISEVCYKIDEPNPKSFLKNCDPGLAKKYNLKIPFCHPEDNVYCKGYFQKNDKDRCICHPGYYGDNVTKKCRPKSEFIQAYNLKEYKVKPGMYCFSEDDCIEGLECKQNFCHCPDGCVYKEAFESCDCGDYYDSDEYWELDFVLPSIFGPLLGLMITCCWCGKIYVTIKDKYPDATTGDTEEAHALNTQSSEVNQVVTVPLVRPSGNTINPPSGPPPLTPYSTPVPYNLDAVKLTTQSKDNESDYNTIPMAYARQPYDPQPSAPHLYGSQPFAPQPHGLQPYGQQLFAPQSSNSEYPGPFSEPPPSYSESISQDVH